MKHSKSKKKNLINISKKLSLISWALINNNFISEMVYFIFILIDFGLQLIIVICTYSFNGSDAIQKMTDYLMIIGADSAKMI